MWLNKSVAIINTILKILDITNLRFIYFFLNKFGFRIGTLKSQPKHVFFPICKCTKMNRSEPKWTEVNQNGPKWIQMDQVD